MKAKHYCIAGLFLLALTGPALAQGVPVADAARLNDETGIANCMAKARASTDSTVSPTRDIHSSMATPGSAGQSGEVGSSDVMGATNVASGGFTIPSLAITGANGTVDGIDLSGILQVTESVAALKSQNLDQSINSVAAVAAALTSNKSNWQSASNTIGTANGIQAAFDQNSGTRLGTGAAWNQAVQVGNVWLSIQNQRLTEQTAISAATTKVMTYDQKQAGFVKSTAQAPDNQSAVNTKITTFGTVADDLGRAQAAARAGDPVTPSVTGQ